MRRLPDLLRTIRSALLPLAGLYAAATCAQNGGESLTVTVSDGGAATVVEYYHPDFDHYFITARADEIARLDNGTFPGWTRTGKSFKAYVAARAGTTAVCRFFSTSFAPKSSHFYGASLSECTVVKANTDWHFEGDVLYVTPPAADGSCPIGTNTVYRLYNNGLGAAPNHRYTTDAVTRRKMLAKGWIPEGDGTFGVMMCAPN